MTENATSAFLGNPYTWSNIKIELNDVQPLHGGVRVLLPGYTVGQAFVTQFSSETTVRRGQVQAPIGQLCVSGIEPASP
jgi:hypothetical protein